MARRTAVLFYRIGPYHFSRLREAGKRLDITAVEFINRDSEYAWEEVPGQEGFKRQTLFREDSRDAAKPSKVAGRVSAILTSIQPHAVAIPGWADRCGLAALAWCIENAVPVIMMSETTASDELRIAWKERVKRSVVRLCSSALVGGKPHVDYLVQLGMPASRVFMGYDAVDNEYFARKAGEARSQLCLVRSRHNVPKKYFLASARFIGKKNLPRLVQAYARYREFAANFERWDLVLLGDGPLKPDICRLISDLGLQQFVHLPGFKQYPDLPAYFGLASAFVHVSTMEQWGLVVNEAMAAGLPVIVSERCGCVSDLVENGRNGFTFDPYDVDALAELMAKVASDDCDREAMGRASREIISRWGPETFADSLSKAVGAALSAPRPRASVFDKALLSALMHR